MSITHKGRFPPFMTTFPTECLAVSFLFITFAATMLKTTMKQLFLHAARHAAPDDGLLHVGSVTIDTAWAGETHISF